MIGPLEHACPFSVPNLVWRAVNFVPRPMDSLTYSTSNAVLRIDLPGTLRFAVPKRQSEFLSGRLCAADALHTLGLPYRVGMKERVPIWPTSAYGSISHTDCYAVAAVSLVYDALGVDCEQIMRADMARGLHPAVASSSELAKQPPKMEFYEYTTVIFSAKESLYKAISTRLKRIPDFLEAELLNIKNDTLDLLFEGRVYQIHWKIKDGICLTLLADILD